MFLYIFVYIFIFVSVFLFFYYKVNKLNKILSGLISFFITNILFIISLFLISNINGYLKDDKQFNSYDFQKNIKERLLMKKDIIENKIFLNKSKKDIEIDLGKPSILSNGNWQYSLGYEGILYAKFYILELTFKNENCVYYKIITINEN